MESKNYIEYYSKVFEFAEIDSTFYKIPDRFTTIRWSKLTPDNFRFTARFPRAITHENLQVTTSGDMENFFEVMRPLKDKMLCLLIQVPPSLTKGEGFSKLEQLLSLLDKDYRYALEVRHESWFTKEVYKLLSQARIALAWSVLDSIHAPAQLTTDFVYIRFIGDRSIDEKDFGSIQKDRKKEIGVWASKLRLAQKKVKFAAVAANNQYAGFGPETANSFRKMIGLEQVVWKEMKQARSD